MGSGRTFAGFSRPDGSVGTRNHLLVLSVTGLTMSAARRIGQILPGVRVIAPPYGSGIIGEDEVLRQRLFQGFACHPNVGAVLLLGAKPPEVQKFAACIKSTRKPMESLILDDCGNDTLTLTEHGVRAAAHLMRGLSRASRKPTSLSALFVACECGRSDPSSGLVSNPLTGMIADAVVDAGGRAVIGETMEWFGAEHVLEPRAATPAVAEAIRVAVRRRIQRAVDNGMDLIGNNPGPTNISAGLSTLEEKSLGAVAKAGSRVIQGVLDHGEAPPGRGLWLMDQPWYAPESLSAMTAAGAQITLFTTGPGNGFASLLSPTIKISANPETCARLPEQIDFDTSAVFLGKTTLEEAAKALLDLVVEVSSGMLTFGEIMGEGEEVQSRMGASL